MSTENIVSQWRELTSQFDTFFLDLWGVLIDGRERFPKALEFLDFLKSEEKTIVFVSNTPTLKEPMIEHLKYLGIDSQSYGELVTSGEALHYVLGSAPKKFGKQYYYIGESRHEALLDNTDFMCVDDIAQAQFVLLASHHQSFSEQRHLKVFLENNIPMLCVNPDLHIVTLTGEKRLCAGSVASMYESMGGDVVYIGKPYEDIYKLAASKVKNFNKDKAVMIGDMQDTDIKGARDFAIHAALVNQTLCPSKVQPDFVFEHFTRGSGDV